jgi:hypothetical protein
MAVRTPDIISRPIYRCTKNLAAAAVTANGGVLWEVVPVRGALRVRVRIKVSGNGGTIDLVFVGPNFDTEQSASTAYASLTGTLYTSGNPTQVAVTAGTETKIDVDCYGENFLLIKYTGAVGAGAITYCDVCQLSESAV